MKWTIFVTLQDGTTRPATLPIAKDEADVKIEEFRAIARYGEKYTMKQSENENRN